MSVQNFAAITVLERVMSLSIAEVRTNRYWGAKAEKPGLWLHGVDGYDQHVHHSLEEDSQA
jgi:hypothetical protein